MDIRQFLSLSAGRWFSQRTNYLMNGAKAENSKADITIELISPEDLRVVQLCQEHNFDPKLSWGGAIALWDNSADWGKPKQQGSSTMILIGDSEDERQGKLLRKKDSISSGRYILGSDDALTLIIETDDFYAEERQWFASDNLRLRTTVVKNGGGIRQTSFYSEIRRANPTNQ